MVRLDRKEYRCRHCGAITVISDTDAERLEQLLKQLLGGRTDDPRVPANRRKVIGAGLIALAAVLIGTIAVSSRTHSRVARGNSVKDPVAESSVPNDQVVLSALQWHADSPHGGSYTGVLYNHSGYAIMPPRYGLNLFRGGIKDTSAPGSSSIVITLEPGEYGPVSFRYDGQQADRYEVEQPAHIMRSSFEAVPVPLLQPTLVHTAGSGQYALVGLVRNNLQRPISGTGELMVYGSDGAIVASGLGSLNKLMPGEQTLITFNAFSYTAEIQVKAYEYLLDAYYENRSQSITLEEWKKAGTHTVPSRIVRVNAPNLRLLQAGQDWKPEDFVHTQP